MVSELFRQIRYFKFPFGFPKIFFAQSIVISVCRSLSHQDFAMRYLFWQIGDVNLFSPAENETALERILQFAYVSRPIVALDRGAGFPREPRRTTQACR